MPLSLSKIISNTAQTSFQATNDPADVVSVEYYPGLVTEKVLLMHFDESNEAAMQTSFDDFNGMLARLVKSWDLYEDDSQQVPFPIDASRMSDLPISFRLKLISAIASDIRPEAIAPQTTQN